MVDLLKTSAVVTVTVLPPIDHSTPRKGCTLQSCSYIVGSIDGEYDNVGEPAEALRTSGAVQQQSASIHSRRMRYERSVSPPRSSSSSGYGTGSSSRSFQGAPALSGSATVPAGLASIASMPPNREGTLTSTSSGHSSDDPWYDFMPEMLEAELNGLSTTSPPPLPSRQGPQRRLRSGHSCDNFSPPSVMSAHRESPPSDAMKPSRSQDQIFAPPDASPSKNRPSVYSTPPSKPKPVLESPSLAGRSSNYEDIRRLQPAPQETPGKVRPLNPPDYHHAMQSRLVALKSPDQQYGANHRKSPSSTYASRSEDELSASSGNSLSPRSRRRHNNSKNSGAGALTPSSGSSRNQSPRLLVEAKLKSNGNAPSNANGNGAQKRCSTNLQEELLRLIDPDAVDETGADDSVILTHARPANAVLSANTSVQSADVADMADLPDLPDSEEMDWSQLVHAAARAIQGAATGGGVVPGVTKQCAENEEDDDLHDEEIEEPTRDNPNETQDSLTSWIDDVTEKLRIEAESGENAANGYAPSLVPSRMNDLRWVFLIPGDWGPRYRWTR